MNKIKIRYFSDLHLEFLEPIQIKGYINKIPPGLDEICVCAGDIGNPYSSHYNEFFEWMSKNFKKIFVIAGNHEYYNNNKTIESTNKYLKDYFTKFDNISFLSNEYENYENYCWIGTTLWSKITEPTKKINDVYAIMNLDYIKYNQMNVKAVEFLEQTLKLNSNSNCVVITHHMPLTYLIDKQYLTPQMKPYNQWFASDLENLILSNKSNIKAWIYGHTHTPLSIKLYGIPFGCSPIGYPGEKYDELTSEDFNKSIELG